MLLLKVSLADQLPLGSKVRYLKEWVRTASVTPAFVQEYLGERG